MATAPHDVAVDTFESRNPATGEVVGTFPVHTPADVEAAVARARAAAGWWGALGFAERKRRLLAVRAAIARRAPEVAELVHAENGKPVYDGYLEVLMAGEHLTFAATAARKVLGRRRAPFELLTAQHTAWVAYEPLGVVGLITPWNFPLLIPAADLAAALAAGNAVVLKPSEHAPAVARWLVERCNEAIPEQPVVQLVTGFGECGAALCSAGVDKLAFTGSDEVGRRIMATAAESLTPVSLELGGKDALIVDEDADVDKAAAGAVFGAFWNAGQSCVSLERALVHERVYDAFVERLAERARAVGTEGEARIGPITTAAQLETVRRHVADALARGARAVVGGESSIRTPFVEPIILVDVPEDALVFTEETFGPILPVTKVRDADEAIAKVNANPFGLGASVFARRRATEIAARLRVGACGVNTGLWFYAHRHLPFGGVGRSGFGRTHGPEGLRNFAQPKSVLRQRLGLGRFAFDRLDPHPLVRRAMPHLARLLHGRG